MYNLGGTVTNAELIQAACHDVSAWPLRGSDEVSTCGAGDLVDPRASSAPGIDVSTVSRAMPPGDDWRPRRSEVHHDLSL
jgi:hypothetical protein